MKGVFFTSDEPLVSTDYIGNAASSTADLLLTQVIDGMEYRDVGTGFNVLPRVSGDIVTLDINPQHDTSSRRLPGAIDTQRVATTVSGRLGEWMEIAGLNQDRSSGQSALLGRASGGSTDNRRVLIKVEELR